MGGSSFEDEVHGKSFVLRAVDVERGEVRRAAKGRRAKEQCRSSELARELLRQLRGSDSTCGKANQEWLVQPFVAETSDDAQNGLSAIVASPRGANSGGRTNGDRDAVAQGVRNEPAEQDPVSAEAMKHDGGVAAARSRSNRHHVERLGRLPPSEGRDEGCRWDSSHRFAESRVLLTQR